jgi:hypothetical protein
MIESIRPAIIGFIVAAVFTTEGLTNKRWELVYSPFGEDSDELLFGDEYGLRMVYFLAMYAGT